MSRIPSPYLNRSRPLTLAQARQMYAYQPAPIDPLTQAYVQQNQLATQEGEERYLDTLGGRQGVRDRVVGRWEDYGDSMIADANRSHNASRNSQLGDLASRGLSGSSLRSSVINASNRERNAELRRIKDDVTSRIANADERTSDSIYGMMERRTDVQPNPNQLAQLSQGLGQAGYSPYGGASIQYAQPRGTLPPGTPGAYYANPGAYMQPRYGSGQGTVVGPNGGMYANTGPGSYGSRPSPYAAPPTVNGYDNPLANAQARYGQRQQVDPYAGYSQMMSPNPYGAGMMMPPPQAGVGRFAGRINPTTMERGGPSAPAQPAYYDRSAQNAAYEQQQAKNQGLWNGAMAQEWGGYGKNPAPRTVSPGQLAPSQASYQYGNPIEQLNGIFAGAMAGMPQYPTFDSAYRNYMQTTARRR